jgi:hypothetical protein
MNENRNSITWSCGCKLDGYTLTYCPLHNAAEDMHEALKYIIRELDKAKIIKANSMFMEMPNKAIAKAEGKT